MKSITTRALLVCLITCSFSSLLASNRPNIVLFLADDLGWTGLGSFGSDFYETPHLDQLARKGIRFTNAYSACTVCSPTRASVMTGLYPARLRLTDFIAGQNRPYAKMVIPDWTKGLEEGTTTIAEVLRQSGYRTIQIGKWHLDFPGEEANGPTAHGFDVSHDKPKGTRGYYISDELVKKENLSSNYVTDYLTDKALEEIEIAKESPFFLYFAYHVPHTPIQGREDLVERFTQKVDPKAIHKNPIYAAMVHSLDISVGTVIEDLKAKQLLENTLIVFTSDNGGLTQRYGKHDNFTENLPLRRGKGSAYEGGVRVPAIAYWKGVTAQNVECPTPIMTIDLFPTFKEAAQVGLESQNHAAIDGLSLIPLLRNPNHNLERDLFWHYPHYHAGGDGPYSAIRSGDWRLVEFHENGAIELYNLSRDIGESRDLSSEHPIVREQLKLKLDQWKTSLSAQMPKENPQYDPKRETEVSKN